MDQKTYPNLNPKLKETYDRIMGTATTAHPPAATSNTQAAPAHHETHQAAPTVPQPPHATPSHLSHLAYNASMASKHEKVQASTSGLSKQSLMLPILLAAGGVIFFVGYSIFWLNFFGLSH